MEFSVQDSTRKETKRYKPFQESIKGRFQRTTPRFIASNSRSKSRDISGQDPMKFIKDIQIVDIQNEEQGQKIRQSTVHMPESIQSATSIIDNSKFFHSKIQNNQNTKYKTASRAILNKSLKIVWPTDHEMFLQSKSKKENSFESINLKQIFQNTVKVKKQKNTEKVKNNPDQEIEQFRKLLQTKEKKVIELTKKLTLISHKYQELQDKYLEQEAENKKNRIYTQLIEKKWKADQLKRQTIVQQFESLKINYEKVLHSISNDRMRIYLQTQLHQRQKQLFSAIQQIKSLNVKISCIEFKFSSQKLKILTKKDQKYSDSQFRIQKLTERCRKLEHDLNKIKNIKSKGSLLEISLSSEEVL